MTKKDYTTFVRMIRSQRHELENNRLLNTPAYEGKLIGHKCQIDVFVSELVTIFANDNPKFEAERFISACEIDTESTKE